MYKDDAYVIVKYYSALVSGIWWCTKKGPGSPLSHVFNCITIAFSGITHSDKVKQCADKTAGLRHSSDE